MKRSWQLANAASVLAILSIAACGGNGSSSGNRALNPTATATRPANTLTPVPTPTSTSGATLPLPTETATQPAPTATPTSTTGSTAQVTGFLAVRRDVSARSSDALGALPPGTAEMVGKAFDRSLAHADWTLRDLDVNGATGSDGRFVIDELAAGQYLMDVTKTVDGNLMAFSVPFVVGDDGAEVIAEVAWGVVRTTSIYDDGGVEVRETTAPNGGRLLVRDGRVVEFGDYRIFRDPDGDGKFETDDCSSSKQVWLCEGDLASCPAVRTCSGCTTSCPSCEDCGPSVCIEPIVCTDDRICAPFPYACEPDGTCELPGDRCMNVSSCPDCDDHVLSVCVPEQSQCVPVEVESLNVGGVGQLVAGQQGSLYATAQLSDGSSVDVTWLVDWSSSDAAVASVDSWGTVLALAPGSTSITASLAEVTSNAWPLQVVERPTLQRIHLSNTHCYYPLGDPRPGDPGTDGSAPPLRDDRFQPPTCGQVIRVGATLSFSAYGEFSGGYFEDITDEVAWTVAPPEVGRIDSGVFTALQEGVAGVTASLGDVSSNTVEVRVVTQPTIVSLSVYPLNWSYRYIDGGPIAVDAALPCFECGYSFTLLRGDEVQFQATAHYDTGDWEDVTGRVTWRSTNAAAATIDASGLMTAVEAGEANIEAQLESTTSAPVGVRVVNEATLQNLYIYQEGTDHVVGKGDALYFHAVGNYDVGFERDVTGEVTWVSSNESAGTFDSAGVFTGFAPGVTQLSARLGGIDSNAVGIEVFETSELEFCDPANVNRGVWSDDFNRVILESDCAEYTPPDVVEIRYTVTETQPHGGIFDPCLDLYIMQGETRIRTLREEGCGDPFLAAGAPGRDEAVLRYQLRAFWDLKDETGQTVPPGAYTVFGRFFLYYDPIVTIDVTVNGPEG